MLARRSPSLIGFVLASHLLAHGGAYVPPPPPPPPVTPTGPGSGGGGRYGGPGDVTPPGPTGPRTPGPAGPSAGGPAGPATGKGAPSAPTPSGPTTGGPAGPSAPTPGGAPGGGPRGATTAGRGIVLEHDFDTWDYWWELNKNRFLLLRDPETRGVQTGSGDYYLSAAGRGVAADTLRPTAEHAAQVVLPALKRTIDTSANRDIATACMMAMAKIGSDHPEFEIVDVFVPRLRSG